MARDMADDVYRSASSNEQVCLLFMCSRAILVKRFSWKESVVLGAPKTLFNEEIYSRPFGRVHIVERNFKCNRIKVSILEAGCHRQKLL